MSLFRKKLGISGETIACDFLKKHGYTIIERNYRIRGGEIDIIAKDGDTLVFVEVKTRTTNQYGLPEEAITSAKIAFLVRASQFYVYAHKQENVPQRLDAIVINLGPYNAINRIELIKNLTL